MKESNMHRESGSQMLVVLSSVFLFLTHGRAASRCANNACSPSLQNLARGRTLTTLPGSCRNSSHLCPEEPHPPALMTDDHFLQSWWESGAGATTNGNQVEIRLDLETQFCLSHVVLVFRSPRPAVMTVERSRDFGKSWEFLKLFAHNCTVAFGLPDDMNHPGSPCTSRYSSATPCSGGEVIVRTLDPGSLSKVDPYSSEGISRLVLTNLRIRLLKPQTCPDVPQTPTVSAPSSAAATQNSSAAPFAIYTLLAQGTCLCHGHAEECVPHDSAGDSRHDRNRVWGKCLCTHHTAGDHCERCAALFNDRPWRPANGTSGETNACQKCECNGHADRCHFSQRVWLSTGGTSGGVCDGCRHNTVGRRCQRCRPGYHRQPSQPIHSPNTCKRCWCDPNGSLPPEPHQDGPWCHPRSGQCSCKPGVGGFSCTRCLPGHWGFGVDGCKRCTCPDVCDAATGQCQDSYLNNQIFNVPFGGKIPDIEAQTFIMEEDAQWSKELAVSALHYTGKCSCKEKKLRSVSDLCKSKHGYVIKASVLSAHDKGSYAEVKVKVRKVLRAGLGTLYLGTVSVYPLSWTSRGCTCPILNPGMDYLLAGPQEEGSGRLLVTMQSVVVPWTPRLGLLLTEVLRDGCL
ncbi:netrin-4 [Synchiropus splendidus]|uniref:netrin-4 n=1 Tax=Synchiropus splendidus TaxID=270530 RepID=UPI00237E770C|nr:netrin-4 [Synchiropus splendidus]